MNKLINFFSQLIETIPSIWSKNANFDKILYQVSNIIKSNRNGINSILFIIIDKNNVMIIAFSLKEEYWKEFEGPYFPYYNDEELEQATQRFNEYIK